MQTIKGLQMEALTNDVSNSRYEIIHTAYGFMAYDHDCDEYLYNAKNESCFRDVHEANKLIEDAVYTNIELNEEDLS
jgi:hypothetical protein